MPDYTLTAPDGSVHVTGDGSDRARLLGRGYRDVTKQDGQKAEPAPTGPKQGGSASETKPAPKPEVRNDSK